MKKAWVDLTHKQRIWVYDSKRPEYMLFYYPFNSRIREVPSEAVDETLATLSTDNGIHEYKKAHFHLILR